MGKIHELLNQILFQEELARKIAEQIKIPTFEVPRIEAPALPRLKTDVIDKKNLAVRKAYTVLKTDGRGVVEDLFIKSPSSSFRIYITRDGRRYLEGTYSECEEVGYGFTDDSTYRVQLGAIDFEQSIDVQIFTDESITFNRIYCKYSIVV